MMKFRKYEKNCLYMKKISCYNNYIQKESEGEYMAKCMTKSEIVEKFYMSSCSRVYREAMRACENVAQSNVNVMILGESGTGKEVAAQYIHACSGRSERPFVAVNCSAYPDTLLESELFGHEQGAFTGAVKSREGKFERANTGTLFIDEIGDVSQTTQVKLLRAIESKQIERVGSSNTQNVDFRLITATNKDPVKELKEGRMREDFVYRVSTIVIRIPPLRERQEDIGGLIEFFFQKAEEEHGRTITAIEEPARKFLLSYDYPGNIRELKNIVERMVVLSEDGIVTERGLPILYNLSADGGGSERPNDSFKTIVPWRQFKANSEAEYLRWVLEQTGQNATEAARMLHLSTRQLYNKIAEYGLRQSE